MNVNDWYSFFQLGSVITLFLTFAFGSGAIVSGLLVNKRSALEAKRSKDNAEMVKRESDEKIAVLNQQTASLSAAADTARELLGAEHERTLKLEVRASEAEARAMQATAEIAKAKAASEAASAKAEEFRLDIAKAVEGTAEANRRAEEERLARVKIEERLAPRRVNEEQRRIMVSHLVRFKGRKLNIDHWTDPETEQFAADLKVAYELSGIVVTSSAILMTGTSAGITVGIPLGKDDAFARAIADALVAAGLSKLPIGAFSLDSGAELTISVGLKP